jgi:hypothetical protein
MQETASNHILGTSHFTVRPHCPPRSFVRPRILHLHCRRLSFHFLDFVCRFISASSPHTQPASFQTNLELTGEPKFKTSKHTPNMKPPPSTSSPTSMLKVTTTKTYTFPYAPRAIKKVTKTTPIALPSINPRTNTKARHGPIGRPGSSSIPSTSPTPSPSPIFRTNRKPNSPPHKASNPTQPKPPIIHALANHAPRPHPQNTALAPPRSRGPRRLSPPPPPGPSSIILFLRQV